MLLYEDSDRLVYKMNAVDMEVDGMLQHGHVIDLEETEGVPSHLIVDFGCPGQTAVPVEYGKLFACSTNLSDELPKEWQGNGSSENNGYEAQALLRTCPAHPWKWHPARVLIGRLEGLETYALVEVTLDGHTVREVLPHVQIRKPPSLEDLQSGMFQPSHFYITLNRRKDHDGFVDPGESDSTAPTARERGLLLPIELLTEVFQSMDVVHRSRSRRTCQLWEGVLSSPIVAQFVAVEMPAYDRSFTPVQIATGLYAVYSALSKHIAPVTRTVCIRNHDLSYYKVRESWESITSAGVVIRYIHQILDSAGGFRINRLVLCQWTKMEEGRATFVEFVNDITNTLAHMASVCDRILWRHSQIRYKLYHNRFQFDIAAFTLTNVNAAEVWDLLEMHMDCSDLLDKDTVAQWTEDTVNGDYNADKRRLVEILMECQTGDPRLGAYCSSKKWTLDNLSSLDMRKLNKISLTNLARCVAFEKEFAALRQYDPYQSDPSSEDGESSGSSEEESAENEASSAEPEIKEVEAQEACNKKIP
ncbi:uncharacterized protein LOC129588813 [Paramacrobiotus metropolitanus]|uniref:uncharacterized protein LOC129588813 n=1 Tax=Paramacrobiotus metropolitanus TaxID=2943436 RepID=UPI0024462E12|nr:uncharacterized protein LOC129588813 [Paramacrobiotus metropolitanus]